MSRIGAHTVLLESRPYILASAALGGCKETEGPLGGCFDIQLDDDKFGESSWEKAESKMQKETIHKLLQKAQLAPSDVQYIFAGDLLNQCISSSFGLRDFGIPFFGLYGACSTMAEGLSLASMIVEGGFATRCIALTSSHFASAERQFRFPMEYGGQRTPSAQWTVTGCGAVVVTSENSPGCPRVNHITTGVIVDLGVKDANNMGAAMAPAACDTFKNFFEDTGTKPDEYDLIVTGDLGTVGYDLMRDLVGREGYSLGENYNDCGRMIFDLENQDVHAGGSGCGCAASVLAGHILPQLQKGILKNVLFAATGALMSTTSSQQGESIPGICHLVHLTADA